MMDEKPQQDNEPDDSVSAGEVTQLLKRHQSGDEQALDDLLPLVYRELRQMAHGRMRRERSGHTLSTTALVHEAYLKLVQLDEVDWENRAHFYALASRVMRNVLVNYAEKRKAQKRGGDQSNLPLKESDAVSKVDLENVLAVHQALNRLESIDQRQVNVVECRFFGGLTIQETADALGISPATVGRDWKMARAWLNRQLTE